MFEPVRGGTRGGQAEFKWSDVSADKDRENYLGHSINAPTGRWQKNKDVHWYNRDVKEDEQERLDEIKRIKEAEAEALAAALGFAPSNKPGSSSITGGAGSGANAIPVAPKELSDAQLALEKEEKRRNKALRKEEKRLKKEKRRAERVRDRGDDERSSSRRYRDYSRSSGSRSPSPRRNRGEDDTPPRSRQRPRSRSRSRSKTSPVRNVRSSGVYDYTTRERERERDRRRWDDNNARRDRPGARWGRD